MIMRTVPDTSCKEKQDTFYFEYSFLRKSCRLRDNGGKIR
jgi:hypothetical protein